MLSSLGRRIERLIYFGALLLVVCAIEFYIVETVEFVRTDNPISFSDLANKIEKNQDSLQILFDDSEKPNLQPVQGISDNVQKNRRLLGLGPEIIHIPGKKTESYESSLQSLISDTVVQTGIRGSVLKSAVDTTKPPAEIIKNLRSKQQELERQAVVVWDIESPVRFPVQFSSIQYQVPNWIIADLLLVALVPLFIGWCGSLIFTRQRELLLLRDLTDYKSAFPHILNILPVVSVESPASFKEKVVKVKGYSKYSAISRIISSILRSALLLFFSVPMIVSIFYSFYCLTIEKSGINFWWLILVAVLFVVMFGQVLYLIIQEWYFLFGKDFISERK